MIISVNTEFLNKVKLTPNQFILAQLVLEGNIRGLNKLLTDFPVLMSDIDILISVDVLRRVGKKGYEVTNSYILSVTGGDLFEELLYYYPSTIVRPNGKQEYLKTDLRRSKALYNKITNGRLDLHMEIVKCLKKEVETKTQTGSMAYFKRIHNWLLAEGWKEQEHLLNNSNELEISNGYGTDIV